MAAASAGCPCGEHVPDLRQHAGPDQLRVDFFVQRIQSGHHVAVEQLVDDQLAPGRSVPDSRIADAECLAQYGAGPIGLFASSTLAPPRITTSRWLIAYSGAAGGFGLGDHAGDGQRFFQLAVVDQRQTAALGCGATSGLTALQLAIGEFAEDLRRLLLEHAFDELALLAHFAHAIEILRLDRIVLGLLGQIEQGVVDVLEQRRDQSVDALERRARAPA